MSNVMIAGFNASVITGTLANGTSEVFDLGDYSLIGLEGDNLSIGTLEFQITDAPTGTWRPLYNLDGSLVFSGLLSGNVALTGDAMRVISAFRYVRLTMSDQPASGQTFRMVMKA